MGDGGIYTKVTPKVIHRYCGSLNALKLIRARRIQTGKISGQVCNVVIAHFIAFAA